MREEGIYCRTKGIKGAKIVLSYPSVGVTENVILAAVLAEGSTEIINAAMEPEIEDLCRFLIAAGARINGIGTNRIVITGVEQLPRCPIHNHGRSDRCGNLYDSCCSSRRPGGFKGGAGPACTIGGGCAGRIRMWLDYLRRKY